MYIYLDNFSDEFGSVYVFHIYIYIYTECAQVFKLYTQLFVKIHMNLFMKYTRYPPFVHVYTCIKASSIYHFLLLLFIYVVVQNVYKEQLMQMTDTIFHLQPNTHPNTPTGLLQCVLATKQH